MLVPRVARAIGRAAPRYYKEFWAVRDVSLEVCRGEALGIIGRNGSGKSTLLQMICGTLAPTGGSVAVEGRVAALLELGAGFSPEFTGRENVYLAASLYGLTREQTDARFEQIAAFADIGDFIEQPVKTYSSGMFVRLAFAVVANVDADVLVVDEALAVGDAVFTQKCMRFIRRFRESKSLLFVSHDTSAVMNLCERAIWLDQGAARSVGPASEVTKQYMLACMQDAYGGEVEFRPIATDKSSALQGEEPQRPGTQPQRREEETTISFFDNLMVSDGFTTGTAEIVKVQVLDEAGNPAGTLSGGERLVLKISARVERDLDRPIVGFFLKDRLGQALFGQHTFSHTDPPPVGRAGDVLEASFQFCLPLLPNGEYAITAAIADGDFAQHVQHHWVHDALLIKVSSKKMRYGLVGIPFESITLTRKEVSSV
jgi:lipopolysaccharide transport system ATP-binding protein